VALGPRTRDTKTNRSRRRLRIPQIAVEALQEQVRRQAGKRSTAGELWQEHGLVFTTTVGTPYESHNLRRDFRRVTAAAGLGARWVPKELRTSFVSMMSYQGIPVEEIARLAWHASSRTTEVVYRRELRPVITTGAEIMDQIFHPKQRQGVPAETAGLLECRPHPREILRAAGEQAHVVPYRLLMATQLPTTNKLRPSSPASCESREAHSTGWVRGHADGMTSR
jgi:hypothetical protein